MKKIEIKIIVLSMIACITAVLCNGMTAYAGFHYPETGNHISEWNACDGAKYHFYSTGEVYYLKQGGREVPYVKGTIYKDNGEERLCEGEDNRQELSCFTHGYLEGWYYCDSNYKMHPCNPDSSLNNKYTLLIEKGTVGGARQATVTSGESVTITAGEAPNDEVFERWYAWDENGLIYDLTDTMSDADITKPTATITMPSKNIKIRAGYKEFNTYTSNPANGSRVSSLHEIVINFNQSIYRLDSTQQKAFVKTPNGENICEATVSRTEFANTNSLTILLNDTITEPGQYNVVIPKQLLQDDWGKSYFDDDLILSYTVSSKDDSDGGNNTSNVGTVDDEQQYEPSYLDKLIDRINEAIRRGGKQTVYLDEGTVLSYGVMKILKDNPNITLVFTYTYQNVTYKITLNGKNIKLYEDIPWYGPAYLYKYYGTPDSIVKMNVNN